MIKVGVDLIAVDRIESSLENPRFQARVFSQEELTAFNGAHFAESLAANFAAKEAFSKAIGTGITGFSLSDISVLRDPSGKPYFHFSGKAKELVDDLHLQFSVTLTHDSGNAVAVVVAEEAVPDHLKISPEKAEQIHRAIPAPPSGSELLSRELICSLLPRRAADSHKGTYGKLVIVSGSDRFRGAAALCTGGALRSGAGLVTLASIRSVIDSVSSKINESMYFPMEESPSGTISSASLSKLLPSIQNASAVLVGCGLNQSEDVLEIVRTILGENTPLVLDADGLNVLHGKELLCRRKHPNLVLTPHVGEMSRLMNIPIPEIKSDPCHYAALLAEETGAVVVLKDAVTVISSPSRSIRINTTGNAGMARGGSGDVLAGIIASFLCQGLSPFDAASCGVYLHGLSGDVAASGSSMEGMLPSDLISSLPEVFRMIHR